MPTAKEVEALGNLAGRLKDAIDQADTLEQAVDAVRAIVAELEDLVASTSSIEP